MSICKKIFKRKQLTVTENTSEQKQECIINGKWVDGKWNFKVIGEDVLIPDGKWVDGSWNFCSLGEVQKAKKINED